MTLKKLGSVCAIIALTFCTLSASIGTSATCEASGEYNLTEPNSLAKLTAESLEITQDSPAYESMIAHGLSDLNEMREMLNCGDEEAFNNYLQSGVSGTKSRERLDEFVRLVDFLPLIKLFDGEITWIEHYNTSSVTTGEPVEGVRITTKALNGNWLSLNYYLNTDATTGSTPILQNGSGSVKILSETREPHPSEPGTLIKWNMTIDGISVFARYYVADADSVVTEALIRELEVYLLGDTATPPTTNTTEPDDSAKDDSLKKPLLIAVVAMVAVATAVAICVVVRKKAKKPAEKADEQDTL